MRHHNYSSRNFESLIGKSSFYGGFETRRSCEIDGLMSAPFLERSREGLSNGMAYHSLIFLF